MKDYGPGAAGLVALIIAVLYAEGGPYRTIASLIILAVLITPVNGKSLLVGILETLDQTLKSGLTTPQIPKGQ